MIILIYIWVSFILIGLLLAVYNRFLDKKISNIKIQITMFNDELFGTKVIMTEKEIAYLNSILANHGASSPVIYQGRMNIFQERVHQTMLKTIDINNAKIELLGEEGSEWIRIANCSICMERCLQYENLRQIIISQFHTLHYGSNDKTTNY